MTATELYEIVKDHRDVWGVTLHFDDYGCWVDSFSHPESLRDDTAEVALLGLGVKWLAERRAQPQVIARRDGTYRAHTEHECSPGGIMAFKYTGRGRTVIAAVYAAIAEVKRAQASTENP